MWTNLQIRCIPQWVILWQRFRIRDINSSTTQAPILQRRNQGLLVQDFSTRNIRYIGFRERVLAVLGEKAEFLCANEMRGLRGERDADYEVVETQREEGVDGCFIQAVMPGDWDRAICIAGAWDDVVCVTT